MLEPLLRVRSLVCRYSVKDPKRGWSTAWLQAVDNVDLEVATGETLAIVGESGCGKSTLARAVTRLSVPASGSIRFDGKEIASLPGRQLRDLRRDLQYVFQDSAAALDPRLRVDDLVGEPVRIHRLGDRKEARRRAAEILEQVGLSADFAARRPHELSGGQRQRIGIARALVLGPKLIVLDEPVSALDVSVQAQVVNLLRDIQANQGTALVLIVHDLAVAASIADRVAVMYLGKVVETGTPAQLFARPQHPYTQALLAAVPDPDPAKRTATLAPIGGELPNPLDPPSGCVFRTRCPRAEDHCSRERPALVQATETAGEVACHFPGTDAATEECRAA